MTLQYTLNCVIFGNDPYDEIFPVNIGSDTMIHFLKETIFEKINVPNGVKAMDLKLFKVDIPLTWKKGNKDEDIINLCTNDLGDSGVEMTGGIKGVNEYFLVKPNNKNIHIIIQFPTALGIGSLASGIAELQLQKKEIWVRHNDNCDSISENILKKFSVLNVGNLIPVLKTWLKIEEVEVFVIRNGNETLDDNKLVAELYNTKDNAYEIIVTDNDDESSKGKEYANNIQLKQAENAFQIEYQGTTLDILYLRLKSFHDKWYKRSKPYYAPYLTIIQNSGSGKTRLVGELRTKGIYVLYICNRHKPNTGYPASTPYAEKILETIKNGKFKALLSLAIKQIKDNNWSEDEFWNIQIKAEHKTRCTEFWDSAFKSLEPSGSLDCNNETFVENLFPDRDICVVCCIDEAHELLEKIHNYSEETYFVQWRRQIQNISWHKFFSILLSTNRKIGNFLPPVTKDNNSARFPDFEIFPAYLDVNTMDALASLAENANNDYNPKRTVYLGIPLWGSLSQAGVDLIDITLLASRKIRNFSMNNKDYLANLACTACSLALEVSPRIAEVDSLIASHMATAIGTSLDHTSILCTYPSDPILASGALKGITDASWKNSLDTLLELLSRGVVEAGERGELVNRILFLKAYVDAVNECFPEKPLYLQKVPLKSFLKSLLHNEVNGLNELLENMKIEEAEIGFNHWTALLATNQGYVELGGTKFLSEELVIEAYHRHTAFKMPLGFYDIDHIIPFKYPDGYGIISIQNKNAKKTTFNNTTDITSLIHPKTAFGKNISGYKIIGIYVDLGLDNATAEIKSKNTMELRVIYIQGIGSFKCCDDEIEKRLSKILFTRPWPLDTQWSMLNEEEDLDREDVIKSFLPLVFKQKQSLIDKWKLI